jgi:hypothetical protein
VTRVLGLLDLYEATGDLEHLLFAREIQQRQDDLFWDSEGGAYFASPEGDSSVLVSDSERRRGGRSIWGMLGPLEGIPGWCRTSSELCFNLESLPIQ